MVELQAVTNHRSPVELKSLRDSWLLLFSEGGGEKVTGSSGLCNEVTLQLWLVVSFSLVLLFFELFALDCTLSYQNKFLLGWSV